MGMFSENDTGLRCSDCTYADNADKTIEQLRKENEMLKQESADFKKLLDEVIIKETGYTK